MENNNDIQLIKIEAVVREEMFVDVKKALTDIGVNGITAYQVVGCGIQRGMSAVSYTHLRAPRPY